MNRSVVALAGSVDETEFPQEIMSMMGMRENMGQEEGLNLVSE